MKVFPWESETAYNTSVYSQSGVISFLQNQGARGCAAHPQCNKVSCGPFSVPRPPHCTDTAGGTGVWIGIHMFLKGFLLRDRQGPKIWCLLRSTFHKIKSEDAVLQICNKIAFLKWGNIDWFSPSDGELSTTKSIWGSQVIIPKTAGVLFVSFFVVQGKILWWLKLFVDIYLLRIRWRKRRCSQWWWFRMR